MAQTITDEDLTDIHCEEKQSHDRRNERAYKDIDSSSSSSCSGVRLKEVPLNLMRSHVVQQFANDVMVFTGAWDESGVYLYQAFNDQITEHALTHQTLGGPFFKPTRMTWAKPSFAWVLYRSGYARKHNQERILKIKLSHETIALLLSHCECKGGGGGSKGRVQWDPERDIMTSEGKEPRKMLRRRAIQMGFSQELSQYYVENILSIEDVTPLATKVYHAHQGYENNKSHGQTHVDFTKKEMEKIMDELPNERPYMPGCVDDVLIKLKMTKEEWIN